MIRNGFTVVVQQMFRFNSEVRHSPNIAFHGTPIRALRGLGPVNFSR